MRNWSDSDLESLYEICRAKEGWLSKLQLNMKVSDEDTAYLVILDEYEQKTQAKIAAWEYEIESYGGKEIYFEENEGKQFAMLTEKINKIEQTIYPHLLERLVSTRYKLKVSLMRKIEPEAFVGITDDQIAQARKYPLWKLMGLPRKKNILCLFHKEKSPSFSAGIWGFCYTCRMHIDSIGYLMANRSLTFSEAVLDLSNR